MTTPPALRNLAHVRLTDVASVGGKAASLGQLLADGFRVPDGWVLPADLPPVEREAAIRAADFGPGPFAVRSSGVSEDGVDHSFAGIYESVLNVPPDDLGAAVARCLASASAARAASYEAADSGRMGVIVQRMIDPVAAGVVLTIDPISGDRETSVVTAVRGVGDRLVSGEAFGDEWTVIDGRATAVRQPERALTATQATAVAAEARRIALVRGAPQDVEWAIDGDGALWILQARPMTALPPEVSWESPAHGAYTRQLRFGEWIGAPVTPLFESWLLTRMEIRFHERLLEIFGQRAPRPHHVVVNGWYFYSLNWFAPSSLARSLPGMLSHLVRHPRRFTGVFPPLVRHAVPDLEREFREEGQPAFRAEIAETGTRVETTPVDELPALIDRLADLAGEYFLWIAGLGGAAYKMEINLAGFYRRYLAPTLGGSHLPLLSGLDVLAAAGPAIASIDWWYPLSSPTESATLSAVDRSRLTTARRTAEQAAVAALAESPKRLRSFQEMLALAQRLIPIREEQMHEWTTAWPVMRRAVIRMGEALAARGSISDPEDVFFLRRSEAVAALAGEGLPSDVNVAERRATREAQAKLVPPTFVGQVSRAFRAMPGAFARMVGAERSERAIVAGAPASPGRVTGPVRVIRGPHEFDQLRPGEILVAPWTAPAWTPLFTRAAAVVTDVGSAAAHASIIAREYGIPAVVGCGDATARLRNGMRVLVDGSTGNVEPA